MIVHLGLGAFHRAHQAVYTQDAGGWEICGVAFRNRTVVDALRANDHRYTVISFVAFLFSRETKDVDIGEPDPAQEEIVSVPEPVLSR